MNKIPRHANFRWLKRWKRVCQHPKVHKKVKIRESRITTNICAFSQQKMQEVASLLLETCVLPHRNVLIKFYLWSYQSNNNLNQLIFVSFRQNNKLLLNSVNSDFWIKIEILIEPWKICMLLIMDFYHW